MGITLKIGARIIIPAASIFAVTASAIEIIMVGKEIAALELLPTAGVEA